MSKPMATFCVLVANVAFSISEATTFENNEKRVTGGSDSSHLFPVFDPNCGYMEKDFFLLTRGLSSTLNFLSENLDQLILDAGVGTRILEGQIQLILESNQSLSRRVDAFLRKLIQRANVISETIVNEVRNELNTTTRTKRERIKNTLPWITSKRLWATPRIGEWKSNELEKADDTSVPHFDEFANKAEVLDEDTSDSCIGELFGGCNISDFCQNQFLKGPHSMYSLTHQVIFTHIYEQICAGSSVFSLVPDWMNCSPTLCSRVFVETKAIAQEEYPKEFRDLITEQIVVCSLAGYEDFLSVDWMYKLLFWQKRIGPQLSCFPNYDSDDGKEGDSGKRQKRAENFIDYENTKCSVHFSSVGVGGLAIHLRHFLEKCIPY